MPKRRYTFFLRRDGKRHSFKKRRILPRAVDQGNTPSCGIHTAVNCLESRIRKKQSQEQRELNSPRLSIQHCVDAILGPKHGRGTRFDAVFKFLSEKGVTTEENYPFTGGVGQNQFEEGWVYKFHDCEDYEYDHTTKNTIQTLVTGLKMDGPFYANYYVRYSHLDSPPIYSTAGDLVKDDKGNLFRHAVLIIGYDLTWDSSKGMWTGYWKALDSEGVTSENKGLCLLSVDLIYHTYLPTILLSSCESYRVATPPHAGSD